MKCKSLHVKSQFFIGHEFVYKLQKKRLFCSVFNLGERVHYINFITLRLIQEWVNYDPRQFSVRLYENNMNK